MALQCFAFFRHFKYLKTIFRSIQSIISTNQNEKMKAVLKFELFLCCRCGSSSRCSGPRSWRRSSRSCCPRGREERGKEGRARRGIRRRHGFRTLRLKTESRCSEVVHTWKLFVHAVMGIH